MFVIKIKFRFSLLSLRQKENMEMEFLFHSIRLEWEWKSWNERIWEVGCVWNQKESDRLQTIYQQQYRELLYLNLRTAHATFCFCLLCWLSEKKTKEYKNKKLCEINSNEDHRQWKIAKKKPDLYFREKIEFKRIENSENSRKI